MDATGAVTGLAVVLALLVFRTMGGFTLDRVLDATASVGTDLALAD